MIVSCDAAGTTRLTLTLRIVVIHTASGFHTRAAKALVLGLRQRKKVTGQEVYYFHVSQTWCMSPFYADRIDNWNFQHWG
jgi:hypothetical protein